MLKHGSSNIRMCVSDYPVKRKFYSGNKGRRKEETSRDSPSVSVVDPSLHAPSLIFFSSLTKRERGRGRLEEKRQKEQKLKMSAVPSQCAHTRWPNNWKNLSGRQTSRGLSGRTRVYEHTSNRTRKLSDDVWHEFLHFRPQKWSLITERTPCRSIHRLNLRHWRCIILTTACDCLCMHACAPRNKNPHRAGR